MRDLGVRDAVSRPDISWSSGVAAADAIGLQPWTINMPRHPKTKGTPCRRQRTYHGFKDGDGRKARRLRRPASRLRGLTTIPILEVWAAVVVMPLYAYDEKDFTERSPLDSADLLQCRKSAASGEFRTFREVLRTPFRGAPVQLGVAIGADRYQHCSDECRPTGSN